MTSIVGSMSNERASGRTLRTSESASKHLAVSPAK